MPQPSERLARQIQEAQERLRQQAEEDLKRRGGLSIRELVRRANRPRRAW